MAQARVVHGSTKKPSSAIQKLLNAADMRSLANSHAMNRAKRGEIHAKRATMQHMARPFDGGPGGPRAQGTLFGAAPQRWARGCARRQARPSTGRVAGW